MNPTGSDYTGPYGYQYSTLLDTLGVLDIPPPAFTNSTSPKDSGVIGVLISQHQLFS